MCCELRYYGYASVTWSWMAARSSYLKGKHPLLSGLKPLNNTSQHTSASLLSGLGIDHNRHVHIGVWRGVHTSLSTTCVMWWFQMRGGSMCERERNLWQNVQQGEKEMFWKVTQHKIRPWGCLYTFCCCKYSEDCQCIMRGIHEMTSA